MNEAPIVSENNFNAPISAIWKAITEPDQMRQWFFEAIADFRPEVGFETQFNVRCEDVEYLHIWKVTDVETQKRISYQWQYGDITGDSTVTWELSETPDGTNLKLTHQITQSFPQDDPVFSREAGQGGWDYFLHESLKGYLAQQSA